MTIDREKLIQLLVEKTRMTKAEVETQLGDLTKRILDAAERGKALEIKDFGLFYFDEQHQLSFKPADQLDKEINFQYAGMEPIELKPSQRDIPPAAAKEDAEDEIEKDKSGPETKAEPETDREEEVAKDDDDVYGIGKALADSSKKDAGDEGDEEIDFGSFDKIFQQPRSEVKSREEESINKAATYPGASSGKKAKAKPKPKPKAKKSVKKKSAKKSRKPLIASMLVLLGVAVLAIGYLMFSDFFSPPEPEVAEADPLIQIEEPPATAQPDITDTEEPVATDVVEEEIDEPVAVSGQTDETVAETTEPQQEQQQDQERYGLFGEYVEGAGTEYTVVVHSFRTPGQAENAVADLRQDGYRTIVTERIVDDRNVFRVGIGQFDSIQSALAEAETLPEPYRNQNFIQRVQ